MSHTTPLLYGPTIGYYVVLRDSDGCDRRTAMHPTLGSFLNDANIVPGIPAVPDGTFSQATVLVYYNPDSARCTWIAMLNLIVFLGRCDVPAVSFEFYGTDAASRSAKFLQTVANALFVAGCTPRKYAVAAVRCQAGALFLSRLPGATVDRLQVFCAEDPIALPHALYYNVSSVETGPLHDTGACHRAAEQTRRAWVDAIAAIEDSESE